MLGHKLTELANVAWRKVFSESARGYIRFVIATKIAKVFYRELAFTEFARTWTFDRDFLRTFRKLEGNNYHSADRKYFLRASLDLVHRLPGDTAECGVYKGSSSYLICERLAGLDKTHHVFDSFEGLSEPVGIDGKLWSKGDLSAGESVVQATLKGFPVKLYKGWIPARFAQVADKTFCYVHIDVDLFQPTLDSLEFFYPRMVPGGIILCDDYGFLTCPGARQAFNEFMEDKLERIIEVPTGQGFIIKL
jgi:O-methyltransferase